jgi:DNA (cytosine-5)-methyltransferase 1
MADPRGNLALTFLALVDRQRPRWVLWENVPGVLSSNGGRDLGAIIGALEQLGYGWAFRILDAQHFGVPQRRRRLFLVGYLGDWRPPAAVLFEPEGLRGDPPKGQAKGQGAAAFTKSGFGSYSEGVGTLKAKGADVGGGSETLMVIPFVKAKRAQSSEDDETWEADRPAPTLSVFDSGDTRATVAIVTSTVTSKWATGSGGPAGNECQNLVVGPARSTYSTPAIGHIVEDDVASTVTRNTGAGGETQNPAFVVAATYAVRRLTPRECERLQGFPDDWTAIPYRGKPAADGPRYKAIGNSMAVPVMAWIGQRIKAWEDGSL